MSSTPSGLGREYLSLGLNAMARAHETNYFAAGHQAGAILSACFFAQEVDLEPGVVESLRSMIDRDWAGTPLCEPLPEAPAPHGVAPILDALRDNSTKLRQAGHNVILPTLALKAFDRRPEELTAARVDGVVHLIESFQTSDDITLDGAPLVDFSEPAEAAELVLREFLTGVVRFEGRGQGWTGHLLTYSRALLDLGELGHDELVSHCTPAFRLYLKRLRVGPLETDGQHQEHPADPLRPDQLAYWVQRRDRPSGFGHNLKYPYGFYGLLSAIDDDELAERCWSVAYRVL